MGEDGYINRKELLELPVSVHSFLVLKQYAFEHHDAELFNKLVSEYLDEIPIRELMHIISAANAILENNEYEEMLNLIFVH